MIKNIIIILVILSGCTFVPYNANDVYEERANIPQDEAPHYKNSLEWWYYTGHLTDDDTGTEYGIEYVVFHFNPRNKKDYVMVNFAITDPSTNQFYYDYVIKPLGALMKPELPLNFSFSKGTGSYGLSGEMGRYKLKSQMRNESIQIDLQTKIDKSVAMQNGTGYEKYGEYAEAGYYSYPRLETKGTLTLNKETHNVSGELWYDRQWNCIGVWQKDVAWDWFSIQFDDPKSELMIYQLYHKEHDKIIYGGSYHDAEGRLHELQDGDISLTELDYWISGESKIKYPVKWKLEIKDIDVNVEIKAVMPQQELKLKFTPIHKMYYWEGMCKATGNIKGESVVGNSYVEMTNRSLIKRSD